MEREQQKTKQDKIHMPAQLLLKIQHDSIFFGQMLSSCLCVCACHASAAWFFEAAAAESDVGLE